MQKILSYVFKVPDCFPGMQKEAEMSSGLLPALLVSFKSIVPGLEEFPFSGHLYRFCPDILDVLARSIYIISRELLSEASHLNSRLSPPPSLNYLLGTVD